MRKKRPTTTEIRNEIAELLSGVDVFHDDHELIKEISERLKVQGYRPDSSKIGTVLWQMVADGNVLSFGRQNRFCLRSVLSNLIDRQVQELGYLGNENHILRIVNHRLHQFNGLQLLEYINEACIRLLGWDYEDPDDEFDDEPIEEEGL